MNPLFPVMLGGAIGAGLRYSVGRHFVGAFPWGTLCVNLIGGFAMGIVAALVLKGSASETLRLFVGVGILGGFTTFSAFSLESWQMIERGQLGLAGGYAVASLIGSVFMLGLGMFVVRGAMS
jgi:fluoride exporter